MCLGDIHPTHIHPTKTKTHPISERGKSDKDKHTFRGARDVMVIVVGNGQGDTSSNPGRD